MEFKDAKVAEFRGELTELLIVVSLFIAPVLMPAYYLIGIPVFAYACGIYFIFQSLVYYQLRTGRWRHDDCARYVLGATLALMLFGLYTGNEVVDNKPWQLLFPVIAFILAGSRAGVYWCAAALTGTITVLLLRRPDYAPLSIFIFAIAHITTSYVLYVFTRHNESNIRTISRLSHTDPLTNTYNRQLFNELSVNEFNRARRAQEPLAVYMIDIDHFKKYNDRYGHLAGDQALRNVAEIIRGSARRASDLVFRYGGEEFCVLSSGTTIHDARVLADRIIDDVRGLGISHEDGENGRLTVSIGLCYHGKLDGLSAELLLKRADEALYTAKTEGRDRLVLYRTERQAQLDLLEATK
jgi:diguanylate cyclase (GGDEF)-like protein